MALFGNRVFTEVIRFKQSHSGGLIECDIGSYKRGNLDRTDMCRGRAEETQGVLCGDPGDAAILWGLRGQSGADRGQAQCLSAGDRGSAVFWSPEL